MEVTLDLLPSIDNSYLSPVMDWSDTIAWSHREEVHIRPGLKLHIEKVKHPGPSHHFTINHSPLEIGILISGICKCCVKNKFGVQNSFHVNSGTNMISYMPESSGIEEYTDCPLISVTIHIDPEMANDYLGIQDESLPGGLLNVINGSQKKPYYHFSSLSSNLRIIAEQILSCPLSGRFRQLFFEGKAMEMLAFQLDHLCRQTGCTGFSFTPSEEEKIRTAKDILIHSCQSPPSLFEMAKSVGLTHTRLNRGFRKLFGKTVFQYLRDYRLQKARTLLLETELSVTDIAHEFGFSDNSHFSRQFFKTYGIQPSVFRLTH